MKVLYKKKSVCARSLRRTWRSSRFNLLCLVSFFNRRSLCCLKTRFEETFSSELCEDLVPTFFPLGFQRPAFPSCTMSCKTLCSPVVHLIFQPQSQCFTPSDVEKSYSVQEVRNWSWRCWWWISSGLLMSAVQQFKSTWWNKFELDALGVR